MVDYTATEKHVNDAHDKMISVKVAGTGYAAGDTATLRSKDKIGEAFSEIVEAFWGDTDDVVYGGKLLQKMIYVSVGAFFYLGNRMGFKAVREKGKRPNAAGLAV